MNLTLFIARRYLQASSAEGRLLAFASLVAFVSVALGSMALILALAILGGFERELNANAVKFTAHIEVRGFNKKVLMNKTSVLERIAAQPNIRAVAAYIEAEGLARSKTFIDGVMVRGIETESAVRGIRSNMLAGNYAFSSPEAREIVIGSKLAQKLGLEIGKKLVIYSTDQATAQTFAEGTNQTTVPEKALQSAVIEQFTIVGIYETGMSSFDELYVYIPFALAARMFGVPSDAASGFDILLHDMTHIYDNAAALEKLLGYPFFVRTVYEIYNDIFAWIDLQKQPVPLVLGLITIVAVFNIVATLLMTVVQKISSIGILRALGMQRRAITRIFLLQGMILGTSASLAGCLLALFLCALQAQFQIIRLQGSIYFLSAVPIEFAWQHYALVLGVSVSMSALAAFIPAVVGGRIRLLKALRFQ
ncbi:MAG: ABC transporter permease [Candidatus Kapabacteria bacterium]|jgi:lipoprotein-releasing system permease protein|nr:ABC transporter permease [Candidatus Kapabacteria bacterium]